VGIGAAAMSASSANGTKKKGAALPLAKVKNVTPQALVKTSTKGAAETQLGDHDLLFNAIDSFVAANLNFESSVPCDKLMVALEKCTTIHAVFEEPLRHGLFSMDVALRWLLFLSVAPAHAVEEGDEPFAPDTLDLYEALKRISGVYDLGMQEAVFAHFEDDDEDDDEDEDEEEGEEEGQEGQEADAN